MSGPPPAGPGADLRLEPGAAGAFLREAAFTVDEATSTRLTGRIAIDERHHTPWGIVHGGVYATAIESAASIGASAAVRDAGQVAVGLTNTTQFLRSLTDGRVDVAATALHQGRSQQLWKVDVTDGRGRLVAHGELRLQNLDIPA